MNLKQFLKPDRRKIVIFFVILFLLFFFRPSGLKVQVDRSMIGIGYPVFLTIIRGFDGEFYGPIYEWNFANLIINLVVWYLLSCLIIWIYDKFKKKPQ